MVKSDIILIGPIGTGKSTLSRLLAEKLNLPQCPMDELRWPYYKEIGYEEEVQKRIQEQEGFPGVYRYRNPSKRMPWRDCSANVTTVWLTLALGTRFMKTRRFLRALKRPAVLSKRGVGFTITGLRRIRANSA